MNLRENPALIDAIPEIQDDPLLRRLIARVNREESGLFSIGCGRYPIRERGNHRFSGYIELAFNSIEMVQDAARYLPLFYHFDAFLIEQQFNVPSRSIGSSPRCISPMRTAPGFRSSSPSTPISSGQPTRR